MPTAPSEIDALARLLDDPAPPVRRAVEDRLAGLGPRDLHRLRTAVASLPPAVRADVVHVLHRHHMARIERDWCHLLAGAATDDGTLEHGAFVLARYRYPDLDVPRYRALLDDLAETLRPSLVGAEGADRAVMLAHGFRDDLGFHANDDAYYDPDNSYLNWVLDHRIGIPVSLAVVYLLLGRRLGIPVFGVNMPAHFLVKYHDEDGECFLDLYNGVLRFERAEGERFLRRLGITPRPRYFRAAPADAILRRLVRNLVAIAYETNQPQMLADLGRLLAPADAG